MILKGLKYVALKAGGNYCMPYTVRPILPRYSYPNQSSNTVHDRILTTQYIPSTTVTTTKTRRSLLLDTSIKLAKKLKQIIFHDAMEKSTTSEYTKLKMIMSSSLDALLPINLQRNGPTIAPI